MKWILYPFVTLALFVYLVLVSLILVVWEFDYREKKLNKWIFMVRWTQSVTEFLYPETTKPNKDEKVSNQKRQSNPY